MIRRVLAGLLVVALTVTTGCSSTSDTTDHNDTDVMFLQMMLAHHESAAQLLNLGRTQASRDDIRDLAAETGRAQAEVTVTVSGWLNNWGKPLVASEHVDAHAAHGGLPLLDDTQLADLKELTGNEFDTAFLNVLVGHQHSAVEYARMETAGGVNPQARELARVTEETVREQIQQLLQLVTA